MTLALTPVSGRISYLYDVDTVTGFMLIDSLLSEDGIEAFFSAVRSLILPLLPWELFLAVIARMTRSSMLEVLGQTTFEPRKQKA